MRERIGQVGLVRVVIQMVGKEDWRWEKRKCFQGQVGSGFLTARGQGKNWTKPASEQLPSPVPPNMIMKESLLSGWAEETGRESLMWTNA